MSHNDPQGGCKIVLVPVGNIRTHSPAGSLPAYVTVSQDVLYEVIGDVTPDRQIQMSRELLEQVQIL
jgi:hypothetical protein